MVKQSKAVLAGALALAVFAAALAGCAGNTSNSEAKDSSGGAQTSSSSDGETVYAGKVTAITGNQVTLELGTVEGAGQGGMPSGERMKWDENASGTGSAPSGTGSAPTGSRPERGSPNESGLTSEMIPPAESGAASGSSQSSSGEKRASREVSITLTGETKTVLIPVGLTLSGSVMGGGMPEGGGMPGGNGGNAGNGGGMPTQSGASQSRQSSSGTKQGSAAQSAGRASSGKDYSSITVGMILQITEKTGSDGTQTITAVRVLSK